MSMTIVFQGFRIGAPESPTGPGEFVDSPSTPEAPQVVSQVDAQLLYWKDGPPVVAVSGIGALGSTTRESEPIWGTITLQCWWVSLWHAQAEGAELGETIAYTTGITTTDMDTKTFGMSLAGETSVPGIKQALSGSFSQAESHSVSLSESRSVTQIFKAMPGQTVQIWQLYSEYITQFTKDGTDYRARLTNAEGTDAPILERTFPNALSSSPSGESSSGNHGSTAADGTSSDDSTLADGGSSSDEGTASDNSSAGGDTSSSDDSTSPG
jgi:hypothetical protein